MILNITIAVTVFYMLHQLTQIFRIITKQNRIVWSQRFPPYLIGISSIE